MSTVYLRESFFYPVCEDQVIDVLFKLDISKDSSPNVIPALVLQHYRLIVARWLAQSFEGFKFAVEFTRNLPACRALL